MKPDWLRIVFRELADKWQIPTLVLALVLAGSAVWQLLSSKEKHSREEYVAACRRLVEQGKYAKAVELSVVLLDDEKYGPGQRRDLHDVISRALYEIESSRQKHVPRTLKAIKKHLKAAAGKTFTWEERLRLAQVDEWQGKSASAIMHLREALEAGADDRVSILRRILELLPRTGHVRDDDYVEVLDELLAEPELDGSDLVWAAGRKAELLFHEDRFEEAVNLIEKVLPELKNEDDRLGLEYSRAFGQYSRGQIDVAEPALRALLDRISEIGEVDAAASLLLGRICLQDDRPQEALAFFNGVISRYAQQTYEIAALLGRAEALATLYRLRASRSSYRESHKALAKMGPNRFVDNDKVLRSIEKVSLRFGKKHELDHALAFVHLQYEFLEADDQRNRNIVLERLGQWHRELAEQQSARSEKLAKVDSVKVSQELQALASENYRQAAEHFVKLAESPGILDRAAADALWQGAWCYERVPLPAETVRMLKKFVGDWPSDAHLPEAMFRLAQIHQADGRLQDAAVLYRRLIAEYQRTPRWGLGSLVPLSECYITMGPEHYAAAEEVLKSVVDDPDDQRILAPDAKEFRESLFLLGKLHYHQKRYRECASRLAVALERYANYPRLCAEAKFLVAQSFRELADKYGSQVAQTNDRDLKLELRRKRKENLHRAKQRYREGIDAFNDLSELSDLERTYLKLAYIWYADCHYDLGLFDSAVTAYKDVVDRYERSQVALAAYLQIINSHQRLGQWGKIKAVLERMKWLIEQLPDSAFSGADTVFDRRGWQEWIEWNYRSGLLEDRGAMSMARNPGNVGQF